jgi:hypothetical protein
MSLKGPCVKGLIPRVMLSGGGRTFERLVQVGGHQVIGDGLSEGMMGPWSLPLTLLPGSWCEQLLWCALLPRCAALIWGPNQ